jgi:hypothetical protein
MNSLSLHDSFKNFAQALGSDIHHAGHGQSIEYLDLKSSRQKEGYVRISMDSEDQVLIVEAAAPLASVFPHTDQDVRDLLALCLMASPCQSGKRFFPVIDMANEHLLLTYVIGSGAIRDEADIRSIAEACVDQA